MEFDHSTETISPDDTVPVITIGGTGGIKIPAGDTSTRPAGQGAGVLRLNTTGTGVLEYSDDADGWAELASVEHVSSAIANLQTALDEKLPFVNLTVTTAAATATKTTTEAVTFTDGVLYNVLFTLGNSVSTPTINGVGIRLGTTAASTVTFTIGSGVVVPMLYNASSNTLQLMGSYRTADAVESYRMAWDVVATAGATTTRYKFLMQALDGKYYPITIGDSAVDVEKSISSQQFVIGSPVIYYSGATTVNANAQYASATLFSEVTVSTFAYTANQLSGWTPYANVYLVGNIDAAGLFTLDAASPTSFMTQTLPTVEDGKVYVLFGHMGNSASGSQFRLFLHNQAFIFKNGSLQLYSSRDSYVTTDTDQTITGVKTFDSDATFGFATFGDIEVTDTITSTSLLSFATATGETVNATVGITTPALQVTGGAPGSGKVLTSDATGNATWQTPTSGVTSMADGTVATPGWAFTNETDVGLHRPAAGSLSIVSNNGEQVRVSGVTNAVNYVTLSGNTAGNGPVIGVDGVSTNIDLYFRTKGTGAVYAMNASDGLIYGVFNGAGATASTQYLTFTNAAAGSIPYVQSNGTDATVPIRYLSKSATGYHQFSTTTNNDILTLQSVTSGVNNLTITNAISASSPTISATGSATNININLTPKGSGGVNLTSGPLLIAGASGTSGQVLTSNGAGAPSWQTPSGGGSPGGSTGQIQYNNTGSFAGAANVNIVGGDISIARNDTPTTPTTNRVALFGRSIANRMFPAFMGPSGLDSSCQPLIARNKVAWANPLGNSTSVSYMGMTLTATGTATTASVATTNIHTAIKRIEYAATTASSTAVAGFRYNQLQYHIGSPSTPYGGFFMVVRFGPSRGASVSTRQSFVGFTSNTSAPTSVNPSTSTSVPNAIGVGHDSTDTNWQIMHKNGTSTATKIDTGIAKNVADNSEMYELVLFSSPTETGVNYQFTRLSDNVVVGGTITTNRPADTQLLSLKAFAAAGGTSSTIGISLASVYIETDY